MTVPSLASTVSSRIVAAVAGDAFDPQVRPSERADLQANGVLALARRRGRDPRELAAELAGALDDASFAMYSVAGPGFLNVTLADSALLHQLTRRAADPRLGVGGTEKGVTTVIDYSQPNIAKEMHVGHLRSTVIGDALARILGFLGGDVIRQNHLGDWGTQFGMLTQYLIEHPHDGAADMADLGGFYRAARALFEADPEFVERSRRRVVALQAGDPATLAAWRAVVAQSTVYFATVYEKLGVLLTEADAVGESFYNPDLPDLAAELERLGVAVVSDGALCVFFDDIQGPGGDPVPLMVRKSDGGFGYPATDLAAVRHRVTALRADRILYIVDSRQTLHFQMVFAAARRAGWLPPATAAIHAPFGTVLGADGKAFKTREGTTVRLVDLLDSAVAAARTVVAAKNPGLAPDLLDARAREVGIGSVKYADLSTSRIRDYVFDLDRMLALSGNTGVYLQYAHARIRSILARAPGPAEVSPDVALEAAERRLILHLDRFAETVEEVAATYEPHRLCGYLYSLAQAFTTFYDQCPVLRAPDPAVRSNRLVLCALTGETLRTGLDLLGIAAPPKL